MRADGGSSDEHDMCFLCARKPQWLHAAEWLQVGSSGRGAFFSRSILRVWFAVSRDANRTPEFMVSMGLFALPTCSLSTCIPRRWEDLDPTEASCTSAHGIWTPRQSNGEWNWGPVSPRPAAPCSVNLALARGTPALETASPVRTCNRPCGPMQAKAHASDSRGQRTASYTGGVWSCRRGQQRRLVRQIDRDACGDGVDGQSRPSRLGGLLHKEGPAGATACWSVLKKSDFPGSFSLGRML